jgi:TetR/AcrR family transcriptional repressor of nem operon
MSVSYIGGMARTSNSAPVTRGRGRPREFDIEQALGRAIGVFCKRGFQGTSIGDLEEAMGLTAGSIYKAFKDKEALFAAALDRYIALRDAQLLGRLDACRTGRERVRELLIHYAELSCGRQGQLGCLIVGTAVGVALVDPQVAERIRARLKGFEARIGELVEGGKRDGSIPAAIDSAATARVLLCLLQGMRVIGKVGRRRDEMLAAVDVALRLID